MSPNREDEVDNEKDSFAREPCPRLHEVSSVFGQAWTGRLVAILGSSFSLWSVTLRVTLEAMGQSLD